MARQPKADGSGKKRKAKGTEDQESAKKATPRKAPERKMPIKKTAVKPATAKGSALKKEAVSKDAVIEKTAKKATAKKAPVEAKAIKKAAAKQDLYKQKSPKKAAVKKASVVKEASIKPEPVKKEPIKKEPKKKAKKTAEVNNSAHNFEPRDFANALLHYVRGDSLKREGSKLLGEARKILAGESELDFGRDKRFSDTSWKENGFYKKLGQGYMAFCQALEGLVEQDKEDPLRYEKAKLLVDHITSMASPTNSLLGNPAALKKAYETKGRSLVSGTINFLDDLVNNKGMPSQVDDSGFVLGEDLAVSEGGVVFRNAILEILQYKPTTAQVYEIPLLVITPQINKYYFLDLAPGRSFVEYMTSQGYQVFIVSWRNPGSEHGDWRLENYCSALIEALDAIAEITGCPQINTFGFCAGGITMASLVGYLTAIGQGNRINTVNFAVTLLDFSHPALISIMKSNFLLKFAKGSSRIAGVLNGADLATMFTMLRPKDLIWDNWVNNYLMGNPSPVFDILAWNRDCTNLPAALHEDYLNIFNDNLLAKPGGIKIHGEPVDLGQITQDAFVVGTVSDHLTPWQGCYGTTQLLGGNAEFVLSSAGHVAGLVNPPGNPKAFYMTGPEPGADPAIWEGAAQRHVGSWWEYWVRWAATRAGKQQRARKTLGSRKHPVLAKAPGTYVFEEP